MPDERPPAEMLNHPILDKKHLPGGPKAWVGRAEKANWEWQAAYSRVYLWKAGQVRDWVLHHSFICSARPTHGEGPWMVSGCWDAPVVDSGGPLSENNKKGYIIRYQMMNPKTHGFMGGNAAAKHIEALLMLAQTKGGPRWQIKKKNTKSPKKKQSTPTTT